MKHIRTIDWTRAWVWLFFGVFLLVPLSIVHESVLFAALILALIVLAAKADLKHFWLVLFVLALALRVAAVFLVPVKAASDFERMLNAAQQFNGGNYQYLDDTYFQNWSYQLGFVWFQAMLLKLRDTVYVLKLFNCVVGAATTVVVYLLGCELGSRRAARTVGLLYCFFPMGVFFVTVLSNQVFPTFLMLAGVYYLVSGRFRAPEWVRCGVFGLLLSLANLLRPESVIPVTAVLICLVLQLRKKNLKSTLLCALIFVGVYLGMNKLMDLLFRVSGFAPDGLTNNAPYWKFVLGFNHDSGGTYSASDAPLLADPDAAWQAVRERLDVPAVRMYHLFERKIASFWGASGLDWVFAPFLKEGLPLFGDAEHTADAVIILQGINKWFAYVGYCLSLLGVVQMLRSRTLGRAALILINIVFVTFGVYLLIEVQPRYAFFVQTVCFVLAAPGVDLLVGRFAEAKRLRAERKGEEKNA